MYLPSMCLCSLVSTQRGLFFVFVFFFFGLLRVEPVAHGSLELQLPAYSTVTTMWDLSLVLELHHSSWQCRIWNPLSEARDQTHILMDTSQVHFHWARMGIQRGIFFFFFDHGCGMQKFWARNQSFSWKGFQPRNFFSTKLFKNSLLWSHLKK